MNNLMIKMQYKTKLFKVLYNHTPIKEKRFRDSHHQPWLNDKIKSEIVLRRKKEGTWLEDQSEYSWNTFYVQCRHVANIIKMAQWNYYKELIHENHNDYNAIFNIANSLLFRKLTHQCQTSSLCQLWQKVSVNSSTPK